MWRIRQRARYGYAKFRLGFLGSKGIIREMVDFYHPGNVSIGNGCVIDRGVQFRCDEKATITIGDGCLIGDFAILATYGGNIQIGSQCSINPFCVLYGHGGLIIGNGVRIATHTVIVPGNHNFHDRDTPIHLQGSRGIGVAIADDVWVGASVTITDGVRIGCGSIVGAGAVVTKSIPEYEIWAGVPAVKIGER
jgi:acetyltransferase-like isoleucine patch superfamily enzyme